MKEKEKHCYNCIHLEELYSMARNDDGRYERVLDDVRCTNPNKDKMVKSPCEYFDGGNYENRPKE